MLAELFGIDNAKEDCGTNKHDAIEVLEVERNLLDIETITDFVSSMGVDTFKRSCELFGKLNPTYCGELKAANQADDEEEYGSVAHKLKGAAGSVGLKLVQQHAKVMETKSTDSNKVMREAWIEELEELIREGQIALHSLIAKLAENS